MPLSMVKTGEVSVIKKVGGKEETRMNHAKWFWFAIGYQTLLAYCVSLCVFVNQTI